MQTFNIVLLIWNLVTCLLMGTDKNRAKKGLWRISEARLLGVALLGGALGVFLGMNIFHHKTKHSKFRIGVPLLLFINGIMFYGLWTVFH
ncbi:DUF1294 domain-containing protein [Desulfitobacterium metallireducens]|uniref:Membrane protein n=1 Tax=Desulfitobacterium metallireducens DSM 15288 TaxID=871968 RepID=W0E7V0_9FIRM|nr:DUF1294 domain-containing protein [Desulfitobacterium metallireducens]AHF06842.1 membrane protein [Desulfitobacterium metallireducens DSM 15288]